MIYSCILADPPWNIRLSGTRKRLRGGDLPQDLPYMTLSVEEICALDVRRIAADGCHLWLWTTNEFLRAGFEVMEAWGFKYLAPIHWLKASGQGNWFVHRTQTILFGYRSKCVFNRERYKPNIFESKADPVRHSQKPLEAYDLIESVSDGPRIELFARAMRPGWDIWGDQVPREDRLLDHYEEHAVKAVDFL